MLQTKVCFFVVALILSTSWQLVDGSCSLDINKDLPLNAPVFVDMNHNLTKPLGPKLQWKEKEKVSIICSGRSNTLINSKQAKLVLECGNNALHQNGIAPNLQCSERNVADVIETNKACVRHGVIKHIGFRSFRNIFVKYLEVCYNMDNATVVYTHHTIPGKSIKYRLRKDERPLFRTAGSPRTANASWVYLRNSQIDVLKPILGKTQITKYFSDSSFLSRGHLTPDADGIFISWQLATYFYINVAPQWHIVNKENWLTVEIMARKKAEMIDDDLEIYTGVSGILTLPNENGEHVPLYLMNKVASPMIPVPKWFWKILKYKKYGIAFITLNDPFATKREYLCRNICRDFNWWRGNFKNLAQGFTYCCEVSDLMKNVPEVPPEASATEVLCN